MNESNIPDKVYAEYRKLAEAYDRKWRSYLEHTQSKALDFLTPEYGDRILDSSGGTGLFAEFLLRTPDTRVVISDFSDHMLDRARQRFGVTEERVTIVRADAHKLPYLSGAFDKVYNLNSLHYYARQSQAIDELMRVCKPGGTILILDWSSDTLLFRMFEKFMRLSGHQFSHIYSREELTNELKQKGLNIRYSRHWTWRGWSFLAISGVKENR